LQLLGTVHGLYVDLLLNPFTPLGLPITNEKFRLAVDRQVNGYNADV
jgi:hypothetical protein